MKFNENCFLNRNTYTLSYKQNNKLIIDQRCITMFIKPS